MNRRIWLSLSSILPLALVALLLALCTREPQDAAGAWSSSATESGESLAQLAGSAAELAGTFRLQGEFRQPNGGAYTGTIPLLLYRLDPFPTNLNSTPVAAAGGHFDVHLPEGLYWLTTEASLAPFHLPRTKIDLRSEVTGLVITLLEEREVPLGERPPDASLITIDPPDLEGNTTVSGAPGAVPAFSAVVAANLNAGTVAAVAADASGAFTMPLLYAPPGSSLWIKYDLDGDKAISFWSRSLGDDFALVDSQLNLMPGTIVTVGDVEPGLDWLQPFSVAGGLIQSAPKGWAGWWLSGTLQIPSSRPRMTVLPGDRLTVTADLRLTVPGLDCSSPPQASLGAFLDLRRAFGSDGRAEPWGMDFEAYLFTPTGLPIIGGGDGEATPAAATLVESWSCYGDDAFGTPLEITFTVPANLPEGRYLPRVLLMPNTVPLTTEVALGPTWFSNPAEGFLPPIIVGEPAPPQIPWTLLADYPINGQRGLQNVNDANHYRLYSWMALPPDLVVVPGVDERTGQPIPYRLEPGANWVSATDRRLPNPLHIPFKLPGGELVVEVVKPGGVIDVLGPAQIRQSSVRTPATPGGVPVISVRSGNLGDVYHLTTMSDAFAYRFEQSGLHQILVSGHVEDLYGNLYELTGSYELLVAQLLDLDPAQLPTMPYEQGDAFAPGLHIYPPVPADVTVQLVQMPYSDPARAITSTVRGKANRFGYYQPPPGTIITLTAPGEFRVDVTAVYSTAGGMWAGTMTWGNVVEGPAPMMEAHGRRGLDYNGLPIDDMPAWFEVDALPPAKKLGAVEVYYPFFSGDVHWGLETRQPGDSIHPIITVKDLNASGAYTGPIYDVLKSNYPRGTTEFRRPPADARSYDNMIRRMEIGEAPLFITTKSGSSAAAAPEEVDQWGYWYGTSQRPGVRVREFVSEDMIGVGYWGFDDTYNYQIGVPADGDLPGDLKWEFGGAVLRTVTETSPLPSPVAMNEYAIYSSLWVLLPKDDARGARVTPPFQDATGASINGGPILTLTVDGQPVEIDMLFLPTGVRPGDVLELGDAIAFAGHVGPPLDSRVAVTITSPTGVSYARSWHANKIGWLYDPTFDFAAGEVGLWSVDVLIEHDRPYVGNGVVPESNNTGTVMGTLGRYHFYVVSPGSTFLNVVSPKAGFIDLLGGSLEPIQISGMAPVGAKLIHYTVYDKGVVMDQGSVAPDAEGIFSLTYDPVTLQKDFSMLSLKSREGDWEGLADEVSITLLAEGSAEPRAAYVTLLGEEVFLVTDEARFHVLYLPTLQR